MSERALVGVLLLRRHLSYGDFCTRTCDAWDPCPRGFECVSSASGTRICARPHVSGVGGGCTLGGPARGWPGLAAAAGLLAAIALMRARRAAGR